MLPTFLVAVAEAAVAKVNTPLVLMMNRVTPTALSGTAIAVPPPMLISVTLSVSDSRLAWLSFVRTLPERAVSSAVETGSAADVNESFAAVMLNVTVFVSLVEPSRTTKVKTSEALDFSALTAAALTTNV